MVGGRWYEVCCMFGTMSAVSELYVNGKKAEKTNDNFVVKLSRGHPVLPRERGLYVIAGMVLLGCEQVGGFLM